MANGTRTGVSKAGSLFAVFDGVGDVDAAAIPESGIYFRDTRFVHVLRVRVGGRPLPATEADAGAERRTWDASLPAGAGGARPHVRRRRVLGEAVEETVTVHNPDGAPFRGTLRIEVAGDFRSIFAVRGLAPQPAGRLVARWGGAGGTIVHLGADGRRRTARITLSPRPDSLSGGRARYRLRVPPGASWTVRLRVEVRDGAERPRAPAPAAGADRFATPRVETDSPAFDSVLRRALADARMLVSEHGGRAFLAAGVPWFVALFGRDSIISALQTVAFEPGVARDTLLLLAERQGRAIDPRREEEPGKILHELRFDELSNAGLMPFSPYYGTVDATPLFPILLGEYVRWTGDVGLWRRLRGAAEGALAWMREVGDHDGDGFLDYERHGAGGLDNQGWKDSDNCVVNRDGTPATPPIALVEVQAYAVRARRELAALYRLDGERGRAAELEREARRLVRRILDAYWMPDRDTLAIALERGGRQVGTVTSNAGHALWAGALPRARGRLVAGVVMGPRMFSGWGIRTLAEGEPRYDPGDYQVGAVWPHDTSLIAAGLKRYDRRRDFERVFTAVVEAALHLPDLRLPELFGGDRRDAGGPAPYAGAAAPQAWAAGAVPSLLATALGLEPDAPARCLRVRDPRLPRWLGRVTMRGLRVGGASLDMEWRRRGGRTEVAVLDNRAGIEVAIERPVRSPRAVA